MLVVETKEDGSTKAFVDLGSEKPFEPAKWSKEVVDGIQFLTVTDNEEPILKVTGSSVDVPIRIAKAGVETKFDPSSISENQDSSLIIPTISISNSDLGDSVFINFETEGGTLSSSFIGSPENKVSISEANSKLKELTFTGETRGDAKVSIIASDGFAEVRETLFFSIPNTAPTIEVPSTKLVGEIGQTATSLSDILLKDVDAVDSGNTGTMSLSLSATSGSFVNTIPTSQLVDTSETFNHDDDDNTDELAVFSFFYW